MMFEGADFPQSLEEELFESWLEKGRESKIGYKYLLVVWDSYDTAYQPIYVEERDKIQDYQKYESATSRESLVAAYDLYSESRVG